MSSIRIKVIAVELASVPTQKGSYQTLDVTYKNQDFGDKTETKKVMSFTFKEVFNALKDAKSGDTFTINRVKNDKGYWILRSELTPPSFIKNKTIEGVEKLQDRKYEYQNLVQENTNTNIKISSTFRDATLFTTTFCKKEDDKEIKEYWLKIRKWLWENWDNKDSYPTHDLTPDDIPF